MPLSASSYRSAATMAVPLSPHCLASRCHAAVMSRRHFFTQRPRPSIHFELAATLGIVTFVAASGFGAAYVLDSRAGVHKWLVMPAMHKLVDPEDAHRLSIRAASLGLCPRDTGHDSPVLATKLFERDVTNPIGLAAGYDKHGEAIDALLDVGFGMVEIGSVTPKPQEGNPRPRMFRLKEDSAVINRYGFNSVGHDEVLKRIKTRLLSYIFRHPRQHGDSRTSPETSLVYDLPSCKSLRPRKLLGINLGKNKTSAEDSVDDYVAGVRSFGPYADYLVVNISSPNTPGLRGLQKRECLESLILQVIKVRDEVPERPPLLIKIAPDLSEAEVTDIAEVALKCKVDGIIISNTTISRPTNLRSAQELVAQTGGLSGKQLKPLALKVLRQMYRLTEGKITLVGCGGIGNAEDALDFARAGASAVQLYTSLGYKGPGVVRDIKEGVTAKLNEMNKTWIDIVGVDVRT